MSNIRERIRDDVEYFPEVRLDLDGQRGGFRVKVCDFLNDEEQITFNVPSHVVQTVLLTLLAEAQQDEEV